MQRTFPALLVAGFALFARLLAGMGLRGVLVYLVQERSPEIGIPFAIAASRAFAAAARRSSNWRHRRDGGPVRPGTAALDTA